MHQSLATINAPEFINLQPLDLNPLMSKCEIKVCYLGGNRNQSFISKDVAINMAKTLRGAPIVGHYRDEKEDFTDHGQQVIFDDEGIKFNCLTKPYGFVSPDAEVWFQDFEDTDEFGNTEVRTYLMTTGYLWTEQFPECKIVVEGTGKPQSMELDEKSMKGKWSIDKKSGIDFFIINDAIFSKLCILGDDVEPCFEGASVTAPNVSKTFSKIDNNFKNTLYLMMQDLKNFAYKGGQQMGENAETIITEEPVLEPVTEEPAAPTPNEPAAAPEVSGGTEFKKEEEQKSENPEEKDNSQKDDDNNEEEEEEKKEEKYSLLETEYNKLKTDYDKISSDLSSIQEKYTQLSIDYDSLLKFKKQVEDAEKDAMINKFSMLTVEDKAEIIENKDKYSLEEIESKLSVICVRKKVNFELDNKTENYNNTEIPAITFNFDSNSGDSMPAWLQACENFKNKK